MIAVDTNVLVYAHGSGFPLHHAARRRLVELAEGDRPWAIPVFCLTEFIRVVTHPRFSLPFTTREAKRAVERFLESPTLRIVVPGERFTALFLEALEEADARGNLAFDAQIVALCRESGISALVTEDRDFARFRDFHTEPLVG